MGTVVHDEPNPVHGKALQASCYCYCAAVVHHEWKEGEDMLLVALAPSSTDRRAEFSSSRRYVLGDARRSCLALLSPPSAKTFLETSCCGVSVINETERGETYDWTAGFGSLCPMPPRGKPNDFEPVISSCNCFGPHRKMGDSSERALKASRIGPESAESAVFVD